VCVCVGSDPNGHVSEMGVADEDDDVTEPLSNSVSSLQVTCQDVEMLPAAGGVDSDDDSEGLEVEPSQQRYPDLAST